MNPGFPRFSADVEVPLRRAGWLPGRREAARAEEWADTLHGHVSPTGHRHTVLPAAVAAWMEFGGLSVRAGAVPGREVAPAGLVVDPLLGLHTARTLSELGRALGSAVCPLGEETGGALLAVDAAGRVLSVDHTGDWYLGDTLDAALATLLTGRRPVRLTARPE